ncbi:hypothetical protein [uncultured Dubosiella sp.]|uniref:hypothetical protein n=1 Tax=uncultured Dubosiella sp. TaxID=1937011 RepID=UPI0020812377|nr:hypothetical protein [uncultured Dubosiella sp.]GJM56761.1 hypothetical protein EROP_04540 [Erysipelotrichaceae bacterium OPF54]
MEWTRFSSIFFFERVLLELEGDHQRIQRAEQVFERRYLNRLDLIERVETKAEAEKEKMLVLE